MRGTVDGMDGVDAGKWLSADGWEGEMPEEFAGVLAVPFIVGLVEGAKRMGLDTVWATPVAVGLGVALSVGWQAAAAYPAAAPWLEALLWGIALGLAASGLYSGAKRVGEG